jgi:phi LC3 family holin
MNWLKAQVNIDLKTRMGNYAFWISLASAVLLVLTQFGVQVDNEKIMAIVKSILAVLVILGLVNNPTTVSKGFGDDKVDAPKTDTAPKA